MSNFVLWRQPGPYLGKIYIINHITALERTREWPKRPGLHLKIRGCAAFITHMLLVLNSSLMIHLVRWLLFFPFLFLFLNLFTIEPKMNCKDALTGSVNKLGSQSTCTSLYSASNTWRSCPQNSLHIYKKVTYL